MQQKLLQSRTGITKYENFISKYNWFYKQRRL